MLRVWQPTSSYAPVNQAGNISKRQSATAFHFARHLVYGDGFDLDAPHRVIPIGPGCRVCPRQNCIQRAFPPAGRTLDIRVDQESLVSYRFDDEAPRARPMNLL